MTSRNIRWQRFATNPKLDELREECRRTGRGMGNRMTEIVKRYEALIRHYSPRHKFTDLQWRVLTKTLQERWPQADLAATSPQHIADVLKLRATVADGYHIASMVGTMTMVESTALIEDVYRDLTAAGEAEHPALGRLDPGR